MSLLAHIIEDIERYKYLYNSIGSVYGDDLFLADKRNVKRRLHLKEIVEREVFQKGKKYLPKFTVATGFIKAVKKVISDRNWKGFLSKSQGWKKYNYLTCG
ncbi:unnamed protein product, partial [marine sediment metagenome]